MWLSGAEICQASTDRVSSRNGTSIDAARAADGWRWSVPYDGVATVTSQPLAASARGRSRMTSPTPPTLPPGRAPFSDARNMTERVAMGACLTREMQLLPEHIGRDERQAAFRYAEPALTIRVVIDPDLGT